MPKPRSLLLRYRQLSVWNKIGFWGSVTSLIGICLYFLPNGSGIQQTMTNSPGGIQAGRDVVINSDKHLIHSLSLHVAVAADTLPAEPSGPRIAAGLGSFIALFSADKTRIRFKTDFTLSHQQVGRTRRRVEFIYTPETPDQILGKEIDFLGQIELLVVNYSEIFDTLKFNTKNKNAQLQCLVFLNGVKIATFSTGEEFEGTLNVGQINLSVTEAFAPIPSAYAGLISNR